MAITNEKAELLANYLAADKDRAAELLKLAPEEAMAKINADGNNFTVDEIGEFGAALADISAKMNSGEELDAEALAQVAGGGIVEVARATAIVSGSALVGLAIGAAVISW